MVKNRRYQLGLYEKAIPNDQSIIEKLKLAKESGFDYLELSIDETDEKLSRIDMPQSEREALLDAMIHLDMRINSICLSGHRKYPLGHKDTEMQAKSLEIMLKAIKLASDLGVRVIQLAGYDVYYEQGDEKTKEIFIQNLKEAAQMASYYGVLLGFETMETSFMDTVEKSMEYVRLVDNPYLGVYPDIGNLKNASLLYHGDVNTDLLTGKGHIVAAHLKETIPGHYREISFGTGHTEFKHNIELLKDMGVRLFVGEFWYTGSHTWKEDLKDANTFLREKLDHVFYGQGDRM